ncbi:MAG: hypothetical protein KF893_10160 [Caldilineaceae bacterium]|nr:hypothetical protein [Caldilineaceae bacterium]
MVRIKLFLFGHPRIEQNGEPINLGVRKGIALIVYLAVTRQAHSRDALATLFWPESNQQEARASLRRMLYRINQGLNTEVMISARDGVQLNPTLDLWLDVSEFRAHTASVRTNNNSVDLADSQRRLEAAVELYTDEFMAGFSLPDCVDFDEWQFFQREELRQSLAGALEQSMRFWEEQGEYEQAISFARRWLALDRLHEPVHRHLMRLYACAGQQSAALRQYEECVRILDEELGVMPEEATAALYEAIRQRRFPEEKKQPAPAPHAPTIPPLSLPVSIQTSLPREPMPLVGREPELAQLGNMLANPHCRLISVVGLGGMGKTRLALEAAHRLAAQENHGFGNGLLFVRLADRAPTTGPIHHLLYALSDGLGLTLSGQIDPAHEVLHFLSTRQMLIILDNFEDLLHPADDLYTEPVLAFVEAILGQAAGVKLLVTSREPLLIAAEWRMDLQGLTYPLSEENGETDLGQADQFSAVALFVQFARQVQPMFEMDSHNAPAIYHLCRLVAGSPLALKLAAAWVRVFSCARIVTDIEENMNLLSTQMRAIPPRQRSMRAIFDYTWHLLNVEEQRLFAAISVFVGGFGDGEAIAVTDASPPLLAGLLDRGLVQVYSTPQGIRYTLHDLTRQYAAERLALDAAFAQQIRQRHTDYYVGFLARLKEAIVGGQQSAALAAISQEMGNLEQMWATLLDAGDLDSLQITAEPLWRYHWSRTPGKKGKEFFTEAIDRLVSSPRLQEDPTLPVVLRTLYAMRGEFHYFLGDYDLAHSDFQVALAIARQRNLRKEEMDMVVILSSIARWQGATVDAERSLQGALGFYREIGDLAGEADVQHELAQLYVYTGRYEEARACASASLAISLDLERPDWIGWAIDVSGWCNFSCGEYASAQRAYVQSLEYFQQINHQLGVALAWGGLGMVAWAEGRQRWAEAQKLMERSLERCRHLHHQFHISSRLSILAQLNNDAERYREAEIYAREGFEIAHRVGSPLFTALNLCCLAESLYYRGDLARSRPYVHQALRLAHEIEQTPALLIALLCYATLQVIESELLEDAEASQIAGRIQAVALLQRVADHPAGWAIYRQKAKRLLDEVSRKWPAQQISAATDYTQAHSFEEQVQAILKDTAA